MPALEELRARDLRALVSLVQDERRRVEPAPRGMPGSALQAVRDLIPCDDVVFLETDVEEMRILLMQEAPGSAPGTRDTCDGFWRNFWDSPISQADRTGDYCTVTQSTDFMSDRQLRRSGMFTDYLRYFNLGFELVVPLPRTAGPSRKLLLYRDRRGFTERERAILWLLRPHLNAIYQRAAWERGLGARLTNREREVLQLVARGFSNADIAEQLVLSVATVRKHMENIFDRLGVRSRAAAVAVAYPQVPLLDLQHPAIPAARRERMGAGSECVMPPSDMFWSNG